MKYLFVCLHVRVFKNRHLTLGSKPKGKKGSLLESPVTNPKRNYILGRLGCSS